MDSLILLRALVLVYIPQSGLHIVEEKWLQDTTSDGVEASRLNAAQSKKNYAAR